MIQLHPFLYARALGGSNYNVSANFQAKLEELLCVRQPVNMYVDTFYQ